MTDGHLDLKNIPGTWKELFKQAGVSKKDIKHNSDAVMAVLVNFGFIPRSMLPKRLQEIEKKKEEEAKKKEEEEEERAPRQPRRPLKSEKKEREEERRGRLLFDFDAAEEGELDAKQGDVVVLGQLEGDFWLATNVKGKQVKENVFLRFSSFFNFLFFCCFWTTF